MKSDGFESMYGVAFGLAMERDRLAAELYAIRRKLIVWPARCAAVMAIAALMLLTAGCTNTRIVTPTWSLTRTSVLQSTAVPKITVLNDGSIEVEGYSNDGGNQAVAAIVTAAVKAAVKP